MVEPNYSTQGIAVLANTLALNGGDIESKATDTPTPTCPTPAWPTTPATRWTGELSDDG